MKASIFSLFICVTIIVLGCLNSSAQSQCPTVSSVNLYMPDNCPQTPKQIQVVTTVVGGFYQAYKNGSPFGSGKQVTINDRTTLFTVAETLEPGVYTVQGYNCGTVWMNGSVTVPPPDNSVPQVGISFVDSPTHTPTICQGQAATLQATAGFTTYQWLRDNNVIAGATSSRYLATIQGAYTVKVTNNCNTIGYGGTLSVSVLPAAAKPSTPVGTTTRCQNSGSDLYTISGGQNIQWTLSPSNAGTLSFVDYRSTTINWSPSYSGTATIKAQAVACGVLSEASSLQITVTPTDGILNGISGPDAVCKGVLKSAYTILSDNTNAQYAWTLENAGSSVITGLGTTATIDWDSRFTGQALVKVTATTCGNISVTKVMSTQISLPIENLLITSGPVSVCEGTGTSRYVATAENALDYVWNIQPPSAGSISSTGLVNWLGGYTGPALINVEGKGCNGTSLVASAEIMVMRSPDCNMNYNYVRKSKVTVPNVKTALQADDQVTGAVATNITYLDGLGRPMQSVDVQQSPQKRDVVAPVIYDGLGRETRKYLPFVGQNNGWYKDAVINTDGSYAGLALDFYNSPSDKIVDDPSPYTEIVYENSTRERVLKNGAPGQAWQPTSNPNTDHSVKHVYEFNKTNEVILFEYDIAMNTIVASEAKFYGANQLFANKMIDEHNSEVITFTDKDNKIVLKKVQYGTNTDGRTLYAETYYIYDDFGSLVVVLPPEAVLAVKEALFK